MGGWLTGKLLVLWFMGMSSLIHAFSPVSQLACVQCTPKDPRCETGVLEATKCPPSSKYCALYWVFIGASQGIFRGCSDRWIHGCRKRSLEGQELTICYQTCSWLGCNGHKSIAYYRL